MKNFLIILIVLFTKNVYSQGLDKQASAADAILSFKSLNNFGAYGTANSITKDGKIVGSAYLFDEWISLKLILYNDLIIEGFPMNYHLGQKQFEIKVSSDIKVLEGYRVREFSYEQNGRTRYFVSKMPPASAYDPFNGFYEVLSNGNLFLLKKATLTTREPDYSVQFNVGSRDTKLVKTESFYYIHADSIIEVPKLRRKFIRIFNPELQNEIKRFIRDKSIGVRSESDLKAIFDYYNSFFERGN